MIPIEEIARIKRRRKKTGIMNGIYMWSYLGFLAWLMLDQSRTLQGVGMWVTGVAMFMSIWWVLNSSDADFESPIYSAYLFHLTLGTLALMYAVFETFYDDLMYAQNVYKLVFIAASNIVTGFMVRHSAKDREKAQREKYIETYVKDRNSILSVLNTIEAIERQLRNL